jgi:hypothetical protein
MSPSEMAACYRLYAAYCAEIAQDPVGPGRKAALLNMAQAWVKLADSIERHAGDAQAAPSL